MGKRANPVLSCLILTGVFCLFLSFTFFARAQSYVLVQTPHIESGVAPAFSAVKTEDIASLLVGEKININTACAKDLTRLPNIGAVRAEEIISYRQANGGFSDITQLLEVKGIGQKTFDAIKDYITV